MKILIVPPYYNCVIECIFENYMKYISKIVIMEIDMLTVNFILNKFNISKDIVWTFEEFMDRPNNINYDILLCDIKILKTPLLSQGSNTEIGSSVIKNNNFKTAHVDMLYNHLYDFDNIFNNLDEFKYLYKQFIIFKSAIDNYYNFLYVNKHVEESRKVRSKYECYYASWVDRFFTKVVSYTSFTILENVFYFLFSSTAQDKLKNIIEKRILCLK